MKEILVPMDSSPLSEKALDHALREYPEANLTVLTVLDFVEAGYAAPLEGSLPGYWENWYEQAKENAESLFERAREQADEYDRTVETETVVGQPGRAIVEYADEHGIGHVVMGSHGRSGIQRVLLGSVAESVMRRAHCPVTVVR